MTDIVNAYACPIASCHPDARNAPGRCPRCGTALALVGRVTRMDARGVVVTMAATMPPMDELRVELDEDAVARGDVVLKVTGRSWRPDGPGDQGP